MEVLIINISESSLPKYKARIFALILSSPMKTAESRFNASPSWVSSRTQDGVSPSVLINWGYICHDFDFPSLVRLYTTYLIEPISLYRIKGYNATIIRREVLERVDKAELTVSVRFTNLLFHQREGEGREFTVLRQEELRDYKQTYICTKYVERCSISCIRCKSRS